MEKMSIVIIMTPGRFSFISIPLSFLFLELTFLLNRKSHVYGYCAIKERLNVSKPLSNTAKMSK